MTNQRLMPLALVGVAVLLNVAAAVILKLLTIYPSNGSALIGIGILIVIGLNGARFLLWGGIHRRFPLSRTYPLTALFFPLILLVAYLFGEPVRLQQIGGTILICLGVVVLTAGTAE